MIKPAISDIRYQLLQIQNHIAMKKCFTILPALLIAFNLTAQSWTAYTPPFPDTIGIADIEVVNENVVWAIGLRYGADDSLYYYGFANET